MTRCEGTRVARRARVARGGHGLRGAGCEGTSYKDTRCEIKNYKDLDIYQLSYELALEVHKLSMKLPKFEGTRCEMRDARKRDASFEVRGMLFLHPAPRTPHPAPRNSHPVTRNPQNKEKNLDL